MPKMNNIHQRPMHTIPVSQVALYSREIAVVQYSRSLCRNLVYFALIWRMLVLNPDVCYSGVDHVYRRPRLQ